MNNIIKKIAGAGVVAAALGACTPQAQPAEDKCCENAQGTACNPVIETIMTRRSIRKYKDNPVGRDTMQVILECGINAPNALNKQSWEVRVVDNPEFINGITELFKQKNPKAAEDPAFKNMFRNAPTVAFVAQDAAFEAKPYLDRLGFSEGYELIYCIAFGYPDETPDAKPRKKEKVKFVE